MQPWPGSEAKEYFAANAIGDFGVLQSDSQTPNLQVKISILTKELYTMTCKY